ncbi:drug/metabolite transporter (DMT)-like permease [Altererythrobacter atlanticus]|uniref:EamA-like transporter family protein n=1 Tax=Croceibacterium atlanticum TaxID=1267766 RepID=A0A0F7KTK0_9SPHN|nr:DMT family transporter [Croceibacterium atlanticum]AKH42572.1 EamA-like transporter family protein [Croceibacterium atlanticum]MBB5731349.1 drug/metabolite transporter (DMT)-like permease [Croceibacterium atlanticum]
MTVSDHGGTHPARFLPIAALVAGNAALALGPYFVRLSDSGPVAAGFWRVTLALPFLVLLARFNRQPIMGLGRGVVLAVMLGGVFFGLDLASWHVGIGSTRLANAVLFGNSGSLILMIWGFIAIRRLPHGAEGIAVLAALAGSAILLGRSLDISTQTLVGDLFCLLAGGLYAGYLLILHDARRELGGWSLLTWACLAASPVLLAIALLKGEPIWPGDWRPLFGLAASSQLLGQGLLVYSLRHFSPVVIGIALLTQPAVGALAGWLAFGEILAPLDFLGIMLVGGALAISRMAQPAAPSTPPGKGDAKAGT